MRFTCEKSYLLQGLNIAGRTVAQKSSLSAIEGILCKAATGLSLTGYNMETAITYLIDSEVSDPGACVLPAKLFGDIVRRLPEGPVTVVVDDNYKVSIRAGYASFTISAESADDYPDLPDVGDGRSVYTESLNAPSFYYPAVKSQHIGFFSPPAKCPFTCPPLQDDCQSTGPSRRRQNLGAF